MSKLTHFVEIAINDRLVPIELISKILGFIHGYKAKYETAVLAIDLPLHTPRKKLAKASPGHIIRILGDERSLQGFMKNSPLLHFLLEGKIGISAIEAVPSEVRAFRKVYRNERVEKYRALLDNPQLIKYSEADSAPECIQAMATLNNLPVGKVLAIDNIAKRYYEESAEVIDLKMKSVSTGNPFDIKLCIEKSERSIEESYSSYGLCRNGSTVPSW